MRLHPLEGNLTKTEDQDLVYLTSDKTKINLCKLPFNRKVPQICHELDKRLFLTDLKILKKGKQCPEELVVLLGMNFIIILKKDLKTVLWSYQKSVQRSQRNSNKNKNNNFCFKGVAILQSCLLIGSLNSDLFCLSFKVENEAVSDFELKGIQKFGNQKGSVNCIASLADFQNFKDFENEGMLNEVLISYSVSSIKKFEFSKSENKISLKEHFRFNNSFTCSKSLGFAEFQKSPIVVSGNLDGTLSLIAYQGLIPLINLTLFSKSFSSLSVSPGENHKWAILGASNDGYCNIL